MLCPPSVGTGSAGLELDRAGGRVGWAAAAQEVAGIPGPCQRPFLLVAPDVRAHHEDPHRRLVVDPVVDPAEPTVVPAQVQAKQVDPRRRTEVDIAGWIAAP